MYPSRVPEHYLSVGMGVALATFSASLLGCFAGVDRSVEAFIGNSGQKGSATATFVVFTRLCESETRFCSRDLTQCDP